MILKICVQNLIRQNRRKKVFLLLREHVDEVAFPNLNNQLIQLEARLNHLKDQQKTGIVSKADENLRLNEINNSLVEFIAELPTEIAEKEIDLVRCVVHQHFGVRSLIYLLAILSAFLILFSHKKGFDAEIFVKVDKVSFQLIHGDQLFHDINLTEFQIINFHKALLPAKEVTLDNDMDSIYEDKIDVYGSLIEVVPNLEAEGSEIAIAPANLIGISGIQEATIALQINNEIENELVLAIENAHFLKAELNLPEEIYFSGSQVKIDGWNFDKELDFVVGKIINPTHEKIRIDGDTILCWIYLQIDESEKPYFSDVAIRGINFHKLESGKVSSTLKNASIRIPGFDEILLSEGEHLNIIATDRLTISKLEINPKDIQIHLKGRFDNILIGRDKKQINPLLITWILKNHTIKFVGVIFFLILFFCMAKSMKN